MFLDPQCIVIQENFQKQIMNCAILFSLSPTCKKGKKDGTGTNRIVYKLRSSSLEVLCKKYMF